MEGNKLKRWPKMGLKIPPELREKVEIARILESRRVGEFCRVALNAYSNFIIKKHESFKPRNEN